MTNASTNQGDLSRKQLVDRARGEVGYHPGFTVMSAPGDAGVGGEARGEAHPGPGRPAVMPGVEPRGRAWLSELVGQSATAGWWVVVHAGPLPVLGGRTSSQDSLM